MPRRPPARNAEGGRAGGRERGERGGEGGVGGRGGEGREGENDTARELCVRVFACVRACLRASLPRAASSEHASTSARAPANASARPGASDHGYKSTAWIPAAHELARIASLVGRAGTARDNRAPNTRRTVACLRAARARCAQLAQR
jgi:hypothetical protein